MAMHFRSNLNLMSLRLRLMACCGAKQGKPSVKLQHFVSRLQNEHVVCQMSGYFRFREVHFSCKTLDIKK